MLTKKTTIEKRIKALNSILDSPSHRNATRRELLVTKGDGQQPW
jgi:hypothetical protein